MKMVASAKLHKAQGAIEHMLPYQEKMNQILTNFLSSIDDSLQTPYSTQRDVKTVAILVFSSNSSLCGAFNAHIIKRFVEVAERYNHLPKEHIMVYPVGKKIEEAVRKMGYRIQGSYQSLTDKPSYEKAAALTDSIVESYTSGEIDKVEMIYQHFKSAGAQELLNPTYLPVDLSGIREEAKKNGQATEAQKSILKARIDYIVEPSSEEFISSLLPMVLELKIYTSLLDSIASEHAARTMAMQVASDNASDLIQDLTKQYNKSRQQSITNELLDIIGGSMK